jgi:hypothetical protein
MQKIEGKWRKCEKNEDKENWGEGQKMETKEGEKEEKYLKNTCPLL